MEKNERELREFSCAASVFTQSRQSVRYFYFSTIIENYHTKLEGHLLVTLSLLR